MVSRNTVNEVEKALKRVCPHPECVGRDALLDAVTRLVPEPDAWMVREADGRLGLDAVVGSTVHRLVAPCEPPKEPIEEVATAVCTYDVTRITEEAGFECQIAREQGRGEPVTRTEWRFHFDAKRPPTVVTVATGSADNTEAREQAEAFGVALVAEVSQRRAIQAEG